MNILEKFYKYPSYLKKGNSFLANLWSVDEYQIEKAKQQYRTAFAETPTEDEVETNSFIRPQVKSNQLVPVSCRENAKGVLKYSYKVVEQNTQQALIDAVLKVNAYKPTKVVRIKRNTIKDDVTLEICLPDLHIGKSDIQTARSLIYNKVQTLIEQTAMNNNITQIVLVNLGDLFNTDASKTETTKGTKQENVANYTDIFENGIELIIDLVNLCTEYTNSVDFINIRGNHSMFSEFALGHVVKSYYRLDDRVFVHIGKTRYAANYGVVSVMYDHGEVKTKNYPNVFAAEFSLIWAKGTQRFIHLGHLHSQQEYEYPGCLIRYLSSGTSHNDDWHSSNGYVKTTVGLTCFLYHKTEGLIARYYA